MSSSIFCQQKMWLASRSKINNKNSEFGTSCDKVIFPYSIIPAVYLQAVTAAWQSVRVKSSLKKLQHCPVIIMKINLSTYSVIAILHPLLAPVCVHLSMQKVNNLALCRKTHFYTHSICAYAAFHNSIMWGCYFLAKN